MMVRGKMFARLREGGDTGAARALDRILARARPEAVLRAFDEAEGT